MGLSLLFGAHTAADQYGKESKDQVNRWQQSVNQYRNDVLGRGGFINQGTEQFKAGLGDIRQGFGSALQATSLAGRAGRSDTISQGKQTQSGMLQFMQSRGLYGTTALDNASLGISSQVSRQLASIDESIGQMQAGLYASRGQALAGQRNALGSYLGSAGPAAVENFINLYRDKPTEFNKAMFMGAVGTQVSNEFANWFGGAYGANQNPQQPMGGSTGQSQGQNDSGKGFTYWKYAGAGGK